MVVWDFTPMCGSIKKGCRPIWRSFKGLYGGHLRDVNGGHLRDVYGGHLKDVYGGHLLEKF